MGSCGNLRNNQVSILILGVVVVYSSSVIRAGNDGGCPNETRKHWDGVIESPLYPQPYARNTCYNWLILGHPGDNITISFSDLNIPDDPQMCSDSYVELGPDPLLKICGNLNYSTPLVYLAAREFVNINFRGSGTIPGRGFSLRYIRGPVPSPEGCLEGQFQCANQKCILDRWKCNNASECVDGSDERNCRVIQALTSPGPRVCSDDQFGCTGREHGTFTCFWNYKLCDGVRDCWAGEDEAHCTYVQQCGGDFEGPNGVITSKNYPQAYPNNVTCGYHIHINQGSVIQLRFDDFRLHDASTDYVTVYDGNSENSDKLGQFWSRQPPPSVVESTGNRMYVRFHSDASQSDAGFRATFQTKGVCIGNQSECGFNERDCFDAQQQCDGSWDCPLHGGDERGCDHCSWNLFQCAPGSSSCYSEDEHCNGHAHCVGKRDEMNCSAAMCGPHNGTFLCLNGRCIYELWLCDGTDDCQDASDENFCSVSSVKVVTAAVIGSLICALLLVIALGCLCKLYNLRLQEHSLSSNFYGNLSPTQEQILARQMAPPPYLEAMRTSRPFEDVQREFQQHAAGIHASQGTHDGARAMRRSADDMSDVDLLDAADDDVLLDISEDGYSGEVEIIDNLSNSGGHAVESARVRISLAAGITAQWRRRSKDLSDEVIPTTTGSGTENLLSDSDIASASIDSVAMDAQDNKDAPGGVVQPDSQSQLSSSASVRGTPAQTPSLSVPVSSGDINSGTIESDHDILDDTQLLLC